MNWFLTSNSAGARLLRTIVQGVIGCVIAIIPQAADAYQLPLWVSLAIVPVVMAILSPVMAELGTEGDVITLPVLSSDEMEQPAPSDNSLKEGDAEADPAEALTWLADIDG